jgi:hypothetical protein
MVTKCVHFLRASAHFLPHADALDRQGWGGSARSTLNDLPEYEEVSLTQMPRLIERDEA